MKGRIIEMIESSIDGSNKEKAIECVKVLREAAIEEEEPEEFNCFLIVIKKNSKSKQSFGKFWNIIKQRDIRLISQEESERSSYDK